MSLTKALIIAALIATGVYLIAMPIVEMFLESTQERPSNFRVKELTAWEHLRIRSSKLVVFTIFAAFGASFGSFLNVVAASLPRGEPIALRSSACPKCGTAIRRIDNLPIYSYLRLGGKCRACGSPIPARYLIVELVGLTIFASLFLYELVTGAANVPGFRQYLFSGITWILLYTKWDVVGIYFFHCMIFCFLLTLALMEQDRLRSPIWFKVALPVMIAGIVIGFPYMLTVSVGDQTPLTLPPSLPGWLDRALSCGVGGLLGWALGHIGRSLRLRNRQSSDSLTLCFLLLGMALGWQAVLTIAVFWCVAMILARLFGGRRVRAMWLTASTMLFGIAMLHHPAWKWIASHLSI